MWLHDALRSASTTATPVSSAADNTSGGARAPDDAAPRPLALGHAATNQAQKRTNPDP
jgi:hypothetical protein